VFKFKGLADVVMESIEFLQNKLNSLKGYLLDSKAFSVRQMFKVMKRINKFLLTSLSSSSKTLLFHNQKVYISSNWKQ